MAILTSAGITFGDATTQTTAAVAGVTSLNGQTGAITNTSLYAIGSYISGRPQNITAYSANTTIAGSSLYGASCGAAWDGSAWERIAGGGSSLTPTAALVNTGTWRCMSAASQAYGNSGLTGIWVRTS